MGYVLEDRRRESRRAFDQQAPVATARGHNLAGFGLLSTTIYCSVARLIDNKQTTNEASTRRIIGDIVQASAAKGGEQRSDLEDAVFRAAAPRFASGAVARRRFDAA